MEKNYLFPNPLKKIGWILLAVFIVFGIINPTIIMPVFSIIEGQIFNNNSQCPGIIHNNISDEIFFIGAIISLLLISFSKEKDEDEMIQHIRTKSLILALISCYIILILGILLIYGTTFLFFLYGNLLFILVLYVIIFNIELYRFRKSIKNEE